MADNIDVNGKRVQYLTSQGEQGWLNYDRLVLATGSSVNRPDLPGVAEFAFDVDTIESATRLETHLKALAQQPESAARNTVVVAGGGFTGIETATEMPARLRSFLGENSAVRVVVIDRGAATGSAFGAGISPSIVEACDALGIEWKAGTSVAALDAKGVTLDSGEHIEANTVIWTIGFRASPLTGQVPGERDPQGRLYVDANLKVLGQDAIYAAGDVAYAASDDLGNYAAMSCQHAISLGRHAGTNVAAELIGVPGKPYSQPKYVTCLDLGAWGAVYTEGWDRQLKLVKDEAKKLKTSINTVWIYPPVAERSSALAAADPTIPVA